jgi:hypothetical protein
MNIDVVITKIDPNHELCWLGRFAGIPRLFDGEHIFTTGFDAMNHAPSEAERPLSK